MRWPLEMLWEGFDMHIYLFQYSELPITLLLYTHPYWADMTHNKPQLESLYLLLMK